MIFTVLLCVATLVLAKVAWAVVQAQRYHDVPGYFGVAFWKWTLLFPKHKRLALWDEILVRDQGKAYKHFGLSGYLVRSAWTGDSTLVISDPYAAKQVGAAPNLWVKPSEFCDVFGHFGPSLLIAEGEQYKRHRKAAGPAFSEVFSRGMWDAGIKFVDEWIERMPEADATGQRVVEMAAASRQITLMAIAAAGFGVQVNWPEEAGKGDGSPNLELIETLRGTIKFLIVKSLIPKWVDALPIPAVKRMDILFSTFERQVLALVDQRRDEENQGLVRSDLLSRLISASDSQTAKDQLTRSELLSNVHIFMTGGHETTAHNIALSLAYLAIYPEHQDALVAEARNAFGETSGHDKFSALKLTTATFLETLRLYPRLPTVSKVSTAETTIMCHTVPTKAGEAGVAVPIALAKGSHLKIDVVGMGQNTAYWGEDAAEFRPSRFIDTDDYKWPRDALIAFSTGVRGCIGKQAGIMEGTAVLARIMASFRVEPPADKAQEWKLRSGETEFERRERIYEYRNELLVGARPLNIAFVARE